MTWTCSECRQDFTPDDKKYKYNLCHICYFNPAIAKLYRTGEKTPLPDGPPELQPPVTEDTGVVGDNDGLMLASQREMDDDTFQLKIQQVLAPCLRPDLTDAEKCELMKHGWRAQFPARKPDIAKLAYDLCHIKSMLFKLFVNMNIEITPEMVKAFRASPAARPPNMDIFNVIETGRWSAENPPQSAMPSRNPCCEIPLGPPRTAESFLEQLSKPPRIDPLSDAQRASLDAMHRELACEGK